ADSGDQMLEAAPVSDRRGEGQENEVAARHECVGQARRAHRYRRIARERGLGNLAKDAQLQEMVLLESLGPPRLQTNQFLENVRPAVELDAMALAIVEPDGLDPVETRQSPSEGGRRILSSRKQDERSFRLHGAAPVLQNRCTCRRCCRGRW